MDELRAILDGMAEGGPAVLATVARVRGSAYRGPGARRLIRDDGRSVGLVSGGCLEADLARRARWSTEGRPAAIVRYDSTDPEDAWGLGLGCRGVIDILLERVDGLPTWAGFLRDRLDRHEAVAVARVIDTDGDDPRARLGAFVAVDRAGEFLHDLGSDAIAAELVAEASDALAAGRTRFADFDGVICLVEVVPPPPTLIVAGAGPDVLPLVRLAKELGWLVAVVDPRNRPATRGRFPLADRVLIAPDPAGLLALAARPRASAVVMTHDASDDLAMLRALLPSPVAYLGLLGPRRKADDLAEVLAGEFDPVDLGRLRSPVGLDLGAETPAEIALAILAEIQAVLAGHPGGPLRDRVRPIHDRPDPGSDLAGPVGSSRSSCSLGAS